MNKKKITLVLVRKIFIRSYVQTGIIEQLTESFDLRILCTSELRKYFSEYDVEVVVVNDPKYRQYLHQLLFDFQLFKYRGRSLSFEFRIKRLFQNFKSKDQIKNVLKSIRNIVYNNAFIQDIVIRFLKSLLSVRIMIDQSLICKDSDIILLPSSAYDPIILDALLVNRKCSVKSFLLIDNWDNLSSKSIFWIEPDFVSVWGPQSAEHARRIQKFSDTSIFELGCPRFDIYIDKPLKKTSRTNYVLFLGTTVYFHEENVLKILSKFIQSSHELLNCNNLIIYRPHPARLGPTDLSTLPDNVVVDLGSSSDTDEFPLLSEYPDLINNAKFCIGGYTSMLIEAVINNKKYFALRHREEHITSPDAVAKRYEHFIGVDELENVYPIYDLKELDTTIELGLGERQRSSRDFDHIVHFTNEQTFCARLIDKLHDL